MFYAQSTIAVISGGGGGGGGRDRQTDIQTDRETQRETDRGRERETDRQTDRQRALSPWQQPWLVRRDGTSGSAEGELAPRCALPSFPSASQGHRSRPLRPQPPTSLSYIYTHIIMYTERAKSPPPVTLAKLTNPSLYI